MAVNGTPENDPLLESAVDGDVVSGFEGDDTLVARTNNTTLDGGPGADTLLSYGDGNTLLGGEGGDLLQSLADAQGAANNTTMDGGPGFDILAGGSGTNTASYSSSPAGVEVDLVSSLALNDGHGSFDLLLGIQNITGSAQDDNLRGDGSANVLEGGAGDDFLTGRGGADTFKFSFAVEEKPGEAKTFSFTDWLSAKYGKEFGDELPDFEGGHHHHHGKHHHHHGKHDHHHHGKHHQHGKHDHHHKHGGCDDHPQQWGLSEKFFEKNYAEWLKTVVVADLLAQGLVHDENGNGKIDIKLNDKDPGGTPRIEGLTDEQLAQIFGDRDEVTLRHKFHEHDRWYSNTYESQSGDGETTVSSTDGFDTILDFAVGVDRLEFDGLGGLTLAEFQSLFTLDRTNASSTTVKLGDGSWQVALEGVTFDSALSDDAVFADLFMVSGLDSLFS